MKTVTSFILCLTTILLLSCERESYERKISIDLSEPKKAKQIVASGAPKAIGPYSQAILKDNTLYSSGQIGIDPATDSLVGAGTRAEMEQIMKNHSAILKSAGLDFSNVVKCTIYMTDISDYAAINEIYSKYFTAVKPAREAVAVAALPGGASVEMSLVAVK